MISSLGLQRANIPPHSVSKTGHYHLVISCFPGFDAALWDAVGDVGVQPVLFKVHGRQNSLRQVIPVDQVLKAHIPLATIRSKNVCVPE